MFLLLAGFVIQAQPSSILWQKTFGGTADDVVRGIANSPDGGYVTAGFTKSNNTGDISNYHGGLGDFCVVKYKKEGTVAWKKVLGGLGEDVATSIVTSPTGGYVIAGYTSSVLHRNQDDVKFHHGLYDYWVVKLSEEGDIVWEKTYGGSLEEYAFAIAGTPDGGYVVTGQGRSPNEAGGEVTGHHGLADVWVIRLDGEGNLIWQKTLGGSGEDEAYAITPTTDGGYVVAGYTASGDGDVDPTTHKGSQDFWIVKLDGSGNKIWQKTYGGSSNDVLYAIKANPDGSYVVAGYTFSYDGDAVGNHGGYDAWVGKLNGDGDLMWKKVLGGSKAEEFHAMVATPDGGYVFAGHTLSDDTDGDVSGNHGPGKFDIWFVKLGSSGNLIWQKTYGGTNNEGANALTTRPDGTYVLGGYSQSNNGDVSGSGNKGRQDFWVLKVGPSLPIITNLAASPATVCSGQPVTFTATVGNSSDSYSYTLTNGAGTVQQGTGSVSTFSHTLTASGSGVQSFTLLTTNAEGTWWATVPVTVNQTAPPTLTLQQPITEPILQNTPYVALSVSGCSGGSLTWQGPNHTSGTSNTISVPTSATGTLVYSATCTGSSCVSAPGSTTVFITPASVTGNFDGFVNGADCGSFRGWAWDRGKPNTPFSVQILDGSKVIGTLLAGDFRQDLVDNGKGNGRHAFRYPIPEFIKDGLPHHLSARIAESSFILKDSPKALICEGVPVPGGNKAPMPPSPTILIAPLVAQVGVPFSGTLVAFTDSEPLTYALNGLPGGLSINATTRVIGGIPTEAGSFVLTYSASDGELTNSVSFALTVNPASTTTVTGSFEGYLDKVECGTIRGWVWDRKLPNTPVSVEFYHATTQEVFGSTVANIYRDDLKNAGKGNGAHAYSFTVPNGLKDGNPRPVMARVLGSTYDLKGGPRMLTCNAPVRLSAETGLELRMTVLGNPVLDQLRVEIRGAEGQPLRLQLTDARGRLIHQRQIDQAARIERPVFELSQQPSGLLLLRASSGLHSLILKVIKP